MTVSDFQSQTHITHNQISRSNRRSGLTLVEIMIALTMTLIVLGAMMSAFRYASEKMQLGRGVMEMANRLRVAEEFLRNDLANLTLDPRPHTESASPNGFLEVIEGSTNDSTLLNNATLLASGGTVADQLGFYGDIDDSIGMTCRSADGQKFRGSVAGAAMESTMAEIWYFTTIDDKINAGSLDFEDVVRLHRRVLLIRPDWGTVSGLTGPQVIQFIRNNDISVRVTEDATSPVTYSVVANNVADLAIRKNRFAHPFDNVPTGTNDGVNFPNAFTRAFAAARSKPDGADILLTDLAGFDLRVYSPNATVQGSDSLMVEPNDPGYVNASLGNAVGAFVDLGNGADGLFSGAASAGSQLNALTETYSGMTYATVAYDTWTPSYEHDGLDQDSDGLLDEGTNGLDNAGTLAIDDDGERETRPPYPFPLRGIKASLRLIEKNTQQVHQTTVIQSYVPE